MTFLKSYIKTYTKYDFFSNSQQNVFLESRTSTNSDDLKKTVQLSQRKPPKSGEILDCRRSASKKTTIESNDQMVIINHHDESSEDIGNVVVLVIEIKS